MNMKFNKITRLLCFLFISIFIIGIGGEVVKAESVTIHSDGTIQFRSGTYYQYLKTSDNSDAFCLNGRAKAPKGQTLPLMPDLLDESMARKIAAIIVASKDLKYDNGNNITDAAERYYIAQAAIWFVKEGGIQASGTGHPLTQGFYNWIQSNRKSAWGTLMSAVNKAVNEMQDNPYSVKIEGSSYNELTEQDGFLVSSVLKVTANRFIGDYIVSVDSGSAEGTVIVYKGNEYDINNPVTIPRDVEFTIKVPKPSDSEGDVTASITVTPEKNDEDKIYTVKTYGLVTSNGFQNVAVLTSEPVTMSDTRLFHGKYTNAKDVELQKLDAEMIANGKSENDSKVAGATLEVRNSSGAVVGTYKSTGPNEENPKINLPVGEYSLVEIHSPNGYILNTEPVKFSVVDESGLVVKQNGATVGTATISVGNNPLKVQFKKVDNNGNPVEGVQFYINAATFEGIGGKNHDLCAITDSKGLLTIPCDGYENIVNEDGIYALGIDFGSSVSHYEVVESAVPGYTSNQKVIEEFNTASPNNYGFVIAGYDVTIFNPYIKYEKKNDNGKIPVINFTFENQGYIEIGKVSKYIDNPSVSDALAGAHLMVFDPSIPNATGEEMGSGNVIDEWISEAGKTHKIVGIKYNYVYELKELMAPEGHVSFETSIYFKVDENGNITTYEDKNCTKPINDIKGNKNELLLPNDYTKVKISKTDVTGEKEIPGAQLKICTASSYETFGNDCIPDKPEWSWISGNEAYEIDILPLGKYYIIETLAPEGYARQTNAKEFEVVENGEILTINFENKPTKVYISKRDLTTEEELPGAHLKILKADGTPAYDADGNLLEWVSEKEPHYIERLPIGNYILVETIYPEGYQEGMIIDGVVTTEYEFSITDEEYEIEIVVYNQTIPVPNTGISTLNLFAIGALMVFVGYQTIRIYRRKAING